MQDTTLEQQRESLKILREKVLHDVSPQEAFWTCHGTIVRNIYELITTIASLNEFAFHYHVNEDHQKNDFAKWISEVLKDDVLATRLVHVTDQAKYVAIITERVKELENIS